MRALTLTQPWAQLVALGAKTVETRSWRTNYRGPLAIHAAKGLEPVNGRAGLRRLVREPAFRDALAAYRPELGPPALAENPLPLGAFVAVCNLSDVRRITTADVRLGTDGELFPGVARFTAPAGERRFGNYTPGRYAWLLTDVRPLPEPVPYAGALGLRRLDPDLAAQLTAAATPLVTA